MDDKIKKINEFINVKAENRYHEYERMKSIVQKMSVSPMEYINLMQHVVDKLCV